MTEPLAHDLRVNAGAEQMARVRVAEIVEPDARDARALLERVEVSLHEVAAVERLTPTEPLGLAPAAAGGDLIRE
jgi:hypothetical protein